MEGTALAPTRLTACASWPLASQRKNGRPSGGAAVLEGVHPALQGLPGALERQERGLQEQGPQERGLRLPRGQTLGNRARRRQGDGPQEDQLYEDQLQVKT